MIFTLLKPKFLKPEKKKMLMLKLKLLTIYKLQLKKNKMFLNFPKKKLKPLEPQSLMHKMKSKILKIPMLI